MHYVLTVPAGGSATIRLRLTDARSERTLRRLRRGDGRPPRRGGRVLRRRAGGRSHRRRAPGHAGRRWPACSGRSSTTRSTWSSGWSSTAPTRSAGRRRAAQPRLAAPDRRGHHLACPTSGSTRGSRRGTSPSTRWPSSAVDMRVRQAAARAAARPPLPAPERPAARPTSGTSATSTRRCTPGRPGSSTELEKATTGKGDRDFLEDAFQKLMRNFSWWLNRKDADDRNIFQGGFLGLDNIGVFDRSAPLPGGGRIDQADGTAWMALYCQNMVQMATRARPREPGLHGAGAGAAGELGLDRRRDQPRRPRRRAACGTRRTASSTTCCGVRTAAPSR